MSKFYLQNRHHSWKPWGMYLTKSNHLRPRKNAKHFILIWTGNRVKPSKICFDKSQNSNSHLSVSSQTLRSVTIPTDSKDNSSLIQVFNNLMWLEIHYMKNFDAALKKLVTKFVLPTLLIFYLPKTWFEWICFSFLGQ